MWEPDEETGSCGCGSGNEIVCVCLCVFSVRVTESKGPLRVPGQLLLCPFQSRHTPGHSLS